MQYYKNYLDSSRDIESQGFRIRSFKSTRKPRSGLTCRQITISFQWTIDGVATYTKMGDRLDSLRICAPGLATIRKWLSTIKPPLVDCTGNILCAPTKVGEIRFIVPSNIHTNLVMEVVSPKAIYSILCPMRKQKQYLVSNYLV